MLALASRPHSPLLRPFIASFHYHESDLPWCLERIMPTGQSHLMVNLKEDQFRTYHGLKCEPAITRGAVFAGPHCQSTVIDTREQHWLIAVEFKFGGASAFFSMPLSETLNQAVVIEDLWGIDGAVLRERLLEAPTPKEKFCALERILLEHYLTPNDPAVSMAMALLESGVPVIKTCNRIGLLRKTLERHFHQRIGMSPKRFARVRRLQRVMRAIQHPESADWSTVAADHGFADQAHLIHEFRDLTGLTPSSWKPHSPKRRNHVPILEA